MKQHEYYFKKDKVSMRYFRIGKGNPLLFLHGGGLEAMTYKKSLELLAKDFEVIAVDLPFFGESSTPQKIWDFEDFAKFISDFLDYLNLKEITVVGHSFGGGVALYLSVKSKRVSKIILVDSTGIPLERSLFQILRSMRKRFFKSFFVFKDKKDAFAILVSFFKMLFRNIFYLKRVYDSVRKSLSQKFKDFSKIKQKTYIVWAKQDEIIPLKFAQKFKNKIRNSEVILVNGNHEWCLSQEEKFAKIIRAILKRS